jgi:alanine racemase
MNATLAATSPGLLTVDLDALEQNYGKLVELAAPGGCGAVVKADAYGLGIEPVARTLHAAGCRHFFVANLAEGRRLRELLADAVIYVFAGPEPGEERSLRDAELVPVLNSLEQAKRWVEHGGTQAAPVAMHIDTGMSRLGLSPKEVEALASNTWLLDRLRIALVMTHLACADDPGNALNEEQLKRFDALRALLPEARTCVGNSAGVITGSRYGGDLARAGVALYGGNPFIDRPNPMATVVRLHSPILQVRDIDAPVTVGYGATHRVEPPARLATVGAGYADGYPRSLGNAARAFLGGVDVPVVGRVSMDMLTIDVSNVATDLAVPGAMVELMGDHTSIDELAGAAGTISYELLTRLGQRWTRRYEAGDR